jgi:hypothetical protein
VLKAGITLRPWPMARLQPEGMKNDKTAVINMLLIQHGPTKKAKPNPIVRRSCKARSGERSQSVRQLKLGLDGTYEKIDTASRSSRRCSTLRLRDGSPAIARIFNERSANFSARPRKRSRQGARSVAPARIYLILSDRTVLGEYQPATGPSTGRNVLNAIIPKSSTRPVRTAASAGARPFPASTANDRQPVR